MLDNAAFGGQVSFEDGNTAVGSLSVVKGVDNLCPFDLPAQLPALFPQDLVTVFIKAVFL